MAQAGTSSVEVGRWPGGFLVLLPQPQYDGFRADFGICTWVHPEGVIPPYIVILEVDGNDFHEPTKEQAQHDKSRDRFMTSRGAKNFRFTGSEVYRDAEGCALEVLEYILKFQQKHLGEAFKKFVTEKARHEKRAHTDVLPNNAFENGRSQSSLRSLARAVQHGSYVARRGRHRKKYQEL
ncbi:MAG: DUF559 domain-containing protein [Betaproteobacteria bacterium]|nr:DUF559 domain-containing protein [Betaproteobacteria bacterium]